MKHFEKLSFSISSCAHFYCLDLTLLDEPGAVFTRTGAKGSRRLQGPQRIVWKTDWQTSF